MNIIFNHTSVFNDISSIILKGLPDKSEIGEALILNLCAHSLGHKDFTIFSSCDDGIYFETLTATEAFETSEIITYHLCSMFYDIIDTHLWGAVHNALIDHFQSHSADFNKDEFYQQKFNSDLTFYNKLRLHILLTEIDHLGLSYYFKSHFETTFEAVAVQLKAEQGYDLIIEMKEIDSLLEKIGNTLSESSEAA